MDEMDARPDVVRLDGERLKAIAHPLRARILSALRTDGPATASGLAARFGTNSGQTSYHLRVLADAGLVQEEAERGTARERWWRSVHRSTRVEMRDFVDDPGAMERLRWLRAEAARVQDRAYARYLDESDRFGPEWESAAGMSDWLLHLTADELDDLQHEIEQVVQRFVDLRPAAPPDTSGAAGVEPVQVHLRAFPQRDVDLS